MSEDPNRVSDDAPLNPALKSRTDTVYDTESRSAAPYETASAKEGEGEGWPWIWLVVTIVCIGFVIYFVL